MRVLQKAGIPLNRMKLGGFGELKLAIEDLQSVLGRAPSSDERLKLARRVVLVIEPDGVIK